MFIFYFWFKLNVYMQFPHLSVPIFNSFLDSPSPLFQFIIYPSLQSPKRDFFFCCVWKTADISIAGDLYNREALTLFGQHASSTWFPLKGWAFANRQSDNQLPFQKYCEATQQKSDIYPTDRKFQERLDCDGNFLYLAWFFVGCL